MRNSQIDTTPLISIIIATFNAAATLAACFESVLVQDGNYELIVIDGGSTDGTIQLIEQYGSSISFWRSEPDRGIYDAMNKGIRQAHGKWVYFLGADDRIAPGVFSELEQILVASEATIIYGKVQYETGRRVHSEFGLKTLLQNTVHHQAAFYNRQLFREFAYDTDFKIIADYELNLRIYKQSMARQAVPLVIAHCQSGGSSFDLALSLQEMNGIRVKYIKQPFNGVLSMLLKIKYYLHYVLLRKI